MSEQAVDDVRSDVSAAVSQLDGGGGEPAPAPEAEPSAPAPPEAPAASSGRDEKGRFAPKEKGPPVAPGAVSSGAATLPAQPAAPALPELRPPRDWALRPREHWAKLPREVQEEALRLHAETRKLQDSHAATEKNWQSFREVVGPYEAMIRAEGGDPIRTTAALYQQVAALRTAPIDTVAQILGGAIARFGIGRFGDQFVDMLAKSIQGAPQGQQAPQAYDPRTLIQQAKEELARELQQHRSQSLSEEANSTLEHFAASHEFMDDERLRRMMSVLMVDAAEAGESMDYEEAYKRAAAMHPELGKIMSQREAAKAAEAQAAQAQAGRAAASSLKNEPAGAVPEAGQSGSVRDDVKAAIAQLRRR